MAGPSAFVGGLQLAFVSDREQLFVGVSYESSATRLADLVGAGMVCTASAEHDLWRTRPDYGGLHWWARAG
jgi:hypothetical protein